MHTDHFQHQSIDGAKMSLFWGHRGPQLQRKAIGWSINHHRLLKRLSPHRRKSKKVLRRYLHQWKDITEIRLSHCRPTSIEQKVQKQPSRSFFRKEDKIRHRRHQQKTSGTKHRRLRAKALNSSGLVVRVLIYSSVAFFKPILSKYH